MHAFYIEESLDFREARARHALERLLAEPAHGIFRYIQFDAELVGYFVLTVGFSLEFGGRFALLDEFYVTPARRGLGLGGRTLGHIQRAAAELGVAALRLEVDRTNPRLRAFYRRAGFVPHDRDLMTHWISK
jgi:GNAT superfamily N-acetyltransferase